MQKIMAVNAGSSSLKFQLFEMPSETVLAKGLIERIGLKDSVISIKTKEGKKHEQTLDLADHDQAVKMILEFLISLDVVKSLDEITGTGHRVVHGGETFASSALVTEEVLKEIDKLAAFAPLHNKANATGIRSFQEAIPTATTVAVFDTAFHQTMPETSFLYSIPFRYYKEHGIRKYGFHGTSHNYISKETATFMKQDVKDLRIISCHIGNGASICAIKDGKSLDTSMGFTPLEGLTMGTRSGNLDPAVVPYLMEKENLTAAEVIDVFNKQSGLLGISELSSDLRDVTTAAQEGVHQSELALSIFIKRIKETIGAYAVEMGGVDAIVFTAGVGENSAVVRSGAIEGLGFMGVELDEALNQSNENRDSARSISTDASKVQVLIIPTDEEAEIARDVVTVQNEK